MSDLWTSFVDQLIYRRLVKRGAIPAILGPQRELTRHDAVAIIAQDLHDLVDEYQMSNVGKTFQDELPEIFKEAIDYVFGQLPPDTSGTNNGEETQ